MTEKITFIHLPKTGGTTITTYLDDLFDLDRICPIHDQIALERKASTLEGYDLFRGHFMLSRLPAAARDNCRLITVLRDPVRRMLSAFAHWVRDPALYNNFPRSPLLHNHNMQTLALSPLDLKAYTSLGDHLEAAKHALESFFFVGIQEDLNAGCSALFRLLGQPSPEHIRQQNVGAYDAQAPRELIEELIQANWADMELYAHAARIFQQRFLPLMDQPTERVWPPQPALDRHTALHYRMSNALVGNGWHPREGLGPADTQCWRWTGPATDSHIYLPLAHGVAYNLSIRVLNAASTEVLDSLRVFVNGNPVPLQQAFTPWYRRRRTSPGGWLFRGRVGHNSVNDATTGNCISFQVSKTVPRCESDPASNSNMLCGVAISEINFEPA